MSSDAGRGPDGRPDFASFAHALREEADWEASIKSRDRTGQANSDVEQLRRLAAKVEQVGRTQGYL